MGLWGVMKTTVELPDATFRQAKVLAASQGISMKQFFTEAVQERLRHYNHEPADRETDPPWMAGFGALADLSHENRRILRMIEEEFERLDSEDLE